MAWPRTAHTREKQRVLEEQCAHERRLAETDKRRRRLARSTEYGVGERGSHGGEKGSCSSVGLVLHIA